MCCAAKDFSDVDGDRLAGRRTWLVLFGARGAARLLAILAITGAGCVLTISLNAHISVVPACVIAVGSAMLAVSAARYGNDPDRRARRRPYRVFMATQYATNLALIVFVGG
jgi:4-hydroxybenzoate polyprenyltransferase